MIDLSSDTATRPTPEMRQFMAAAPVGDEQRREDPTVNELQQMAAELTGKEAALFLPSGTMCNAIAFAVHCRPGDAVILDIGAHPNTAEAGGPAVIAGVLLRPLNGERGLFTPEQAAQLVTARGTHITKTQMISVENTTNRGGGKVWPVEFLAGLRKLVDANDMKLHMDGARLLNAVVASGVAAKEFACYTDSVWIDLSKGLGAPVGAVLAGSREFIEEARFWKHRLGGAMRQAGIIAAAGVYAFKYHVDRLAEDHANAKLLEAGLKTIPNVKQINGPVETNILLFDVAGTGRSAAEIGKRLEERGVRMSIFGGTLIRAVTHLDVSRVNCERAIDALREACTS
ncbi:MAG: threonine aldolase family protein [Thermomicrobiales bacterium]